MMYNDDCLKILPKLKSNSIDLLLTDPPYNLNYSAWDVLSSSTNNDYLDRISPAQKGKSGFKRRGKPIQGWSQKDKNDLKEYQEWCYSWASLCYPLLKPGASVLMFGSRRTIHRAIIALEDSGFVLRDTLAWKKKQAHHRAQRASIPFERRGDIVNAEKWEGWRLGNLAPLYEPIAWLFKPYKDTITDNLITNQLGAMYPGVNKSNILEYWYAPGENELHETQKPVSLLEYLIKLTTIEGQTVLDPFMGSGSTVVAAKNLNRKYVGIELNKEYFETTKKRVV